MDEKKKKEENEFDGGGVPELQEEEESYNDSPSNYFLSHYHSFIGESFGLFTTAGSYDVKVINGSDDVEGWEHSLNTILSHLNLTYTSNGFFGVNECIVSFLVDIPSQEIMDKILENAKKCLIAVQVVKV